METYRFVPFSELHDFFNTKSLNDDLKSQSVLGICSVADLLLITENYKKRKLKIDSIKEIYKEFEELKQVYTAELEREQLSKALFDELIEGKKLWRTAANKEISPGESITFLALKPTDNTWWPENVFEEMKEVLAEADKRMYEAKRKLNGNI